MLYDSKMKSHQILIILSHKIKRKKVEFVLKTVKQNLRGWSYNKRRTDRQTEHLVSNPGFLDIWLVLPGLADN